MILTRAEENKNRMLSAILTLAIFSLLLLFLILFQIITPNPPFEIKEGGGGQEMAIGMMSVGNDNVEFNDMGKVTDVVTEPVESKQDLLTDENGEAVNLEAKKDEEKPSEKTEAVVIKPVKPQPVKEMTLAEKIAAKAKKNKGKTGGGIGTNEEAGDNGAPDGDPFGKGDGGTGGGSGGGDGDGKGPGSGNGTGGGYGFSLAGRSIATPPKLPSDTKEEGKVVVDIVVDSRGHVIEASPNGRGTTTSSALLKAKARQAAMNTKFTPNSKYEEQRGTITIIFSFD